MALRKYPLLVATMAHIKTYRKHWDQEEYNCQTGMCAAGWIGVLGGGRFRGRDSYAMTKVPVDVRRALIKKSMLYAETRAIDVPIVATEMLGCDSSAVTLPNGEYIGDLYDGTNNYQRLLRLGSVLFGKTIQQFKADIDAYIKDHNLKDPFDTRVAKKPV